MKAANGKLVITAVVLAAAVAAVYGYWPRPGAEGAGSAKPATAKVERGRVLSVIGSTGPVIANQDVPIKCKASGTVKYLPFDVSDRVKEGDILLRLDTDDQDRAVKKAKAALRAAEAELAQARQDLVVSRQLLKGSRLKAEANVLLCAAKHKDLSRKAERLQQLFEKELVSREELETARTLVEVAEAEAKIAEAQTEDIKAQEVQLSLKEEEIRIKEADVAQSQVNLEVQEQQLTYATVLSPISGVVANLVSGRDAAGNDIVTRIGSVVQSGTSTVSGGTTVMTVSDDSRVFVCANVAESDIGKVMDPQTHPGASPQRVRITADSYADEVFSGKVVRVAVQGTINANVVMFEVRIEVDSANKRLLKPRMTANVEIIVAEKKDVVMLPLAAFGRERGAASTGNGEGIKGRVNVVGDDGAVEGREVIVGVSDASNWEVIKGLEEGERVVLNAGMDSKWQRGKLPGSGGRR